MATKTLIEKIEALPPEKRVELEKFVDSIVARGPDDAEASSKTPTFSQELYDRINERRERLRREHGLFDTLPLIREFRETGGR